MTTLLVMREKLKRFYGRHEIYITPVIRFLSALLALIVINQNIGFMYQLKNPAVVLILALLCSFMPSNLIVFISALYVILHLYALSLECALIVGLLFLLMFLLYFKFTPRDTYTVLLTPVCFALGIPYIVPLTMGFVGTPLSAISVGCGTIVYYVLDYMKVNSSVLGNLEAESVIQKFKYVVDNLFNNKIMFLMVVAFAITIIVVYMIRRLSVNYAWTIAMLAGALTDLLIILIGDFTMDISVPVGSTVLGTILSIPILLILQFFMFYVDYARTEHVQFEDDEYYYYVKAVPKVTVAAPDVKVKRINPQRKK